MNALLRLSLVVASLAGIAACSGPQVRSLANGNGAPAYELRGSSQAAIDAEAGKLCARGYELLRSAQSFARPEPDDSAQFLQQAGDWLSGMPGNRAQATIVCKG